MGRVWKATIGLGIGLILTGCAGSPTFLNPASLVSAHEANLFQILFYMAVAVFVFVEVWLIVDVIRFRRRANDDTPPKQIYGNTRLEIVWTAIPFLIVVVIFGLTVQTVNTVAAPNATQADLAVRVVAHRWWWEFDYPDLGVVTANELHVPVGENVYLTLDSADVIHSFWVPQLSGKMDVIPGQTNHLWFKVDTAGEYHGQCAEFCGLNHANMRMIVIAESRDQFDRWVADQQQPLVQPQTAQEQEAFNIITTGICSNCHTLGDHQGLQPIGPNLTHLWSRTTFAGAMYPLTEDNLRRWLQDPQAMKPGNDMVIKLTPDQIDALVAYLKTLK
jgi:cytochrome c oxidase subunit 2